MKLRRRTGRDTAVWERLDSALTALAVVLVLMSVGGLAIMFADVRISARVGDIMVFQPGTRFSDDLVLTAIRSPHPGEPLNTCTLRPAVMAQGGGSLIIEERRLPSESYVVHWAGARTSGDAEDCGPSGDLVLGRLDVQLLINALGGIGSNGRSLVL